MWKATIGHKGGGREKREGEISLESATSLKKVQKIITERLEERCREIIENGMDDNAWIEGAVLVAEKAEQPELTDPSIEAAPMAPGKHGMWYGNPTNDQLLKISEKERACYNQLNQLQGISGFTIRTMEKGFPEYSTLATLCYQKQAAGR